jgi:hypothetical protein
VPGRGLHAQFPNCRGEADQLDHHEAQQPDDDDHNPGFHDVVPSRAVQNTIVVRLNQPEQTNALG